MEEGIILYNHEQKLYYYMFYLTRNISIFLDIEKIIKGASRFIV